MGRGGKNSLYRFHIEDPIYFDKSILVTVEHGHANDLSNDYSSTAYWYQTDPHKPFPPLLPLQERLPRALSHFPLSFLRCLWYTIYTRHLHRRRKWIAF